MKGIYEVRLIIAINVEAEDSKDAEKVAWSKVNINDEAGHYDTNVGGVEFIQSSGGDKT